MKYLLSTVVLVLAALPAWAAEDAAARGLEIAQEAEQRFSGYEDQRGEARLVIRKADGAEAVRKMHGRSMETANGSRNLTVVDEPKDVAGTALLTHSHDNAPDEQWLFLPAMNRVKRIAAGNRSGAFMGSEFSYQDFTAQPVDEFDFKLLREEELDGMPAYVIERVPKEDVESPYGKHVAWLDKKHYRTLKVEFYDRSGRHQKTMTSGDFKQYDNGQWRATKLVMENVLTGDASILRWSEIEFGNGFTERDFSIAALKRAR